MSSNKTTTTILAVVAIASIIIAAAAVLWATRPIKTGGRIKAIGLEVYADKACTTVLSQVDWGYMGPGELKGVMSYIKNTKNSNFTLTFYTTNWSPIGAATFFTPSWNYTAGRILRPGDVLGVEIMLQIKINIQGIESFSYDFVVNATTVP